MTQGAVLVLVAADVEARALRVHLRGRERAPRIVVAGVGTAGDPAAGRALDGTPGLMLNLGFAGALDRATSPGSVVLTTEWVPAAPGAAAAHTDSAARSDLRSWLAPVTVPLEAPGITVDAPFHDAAAGERIHQATGAVTVDMEGARWARLAHEAGWRAVALRVISDRADLRLPRPRHELLGPTGGLRLGRWLAALGQRERSFVGEWRALRTAQVDWRAALGALERVSRILAERLSA